MDRHYPATDHTRLAAFDARPLAEFLSAGRDRQDTDHVAFVRLLGDLTVRLKRAADNTEPHEAAFVKERSVV